MAIIWRLSEQNAIVKGSKDEHFIVIGDDDDVIGILFKLFFREKNCLMTTLLCLIKYVTRWKKWQAGFPCYFWQTTAIWDYEFTYKRPGT